MSDSSYDFAPKEPPPPPPPRPEGEPTVSPPGANAPTAKAEAKIAATAPDVTERLCPACGFRMVGKPRRNRCPECSAPLDVSVADLLQFSSGAWLRSLAFGAMMMGVAIFLQLGAVVLVWVGRGMPGQILHVVAAGLMAVGAWIITAEERGGAAQRRTAAGLIGRWSAVAVAALWVLVLIVFMAKRTGSMHPLMAMTLGVMAVEALTLGAFLSALCARVPHDGLAAQFGNLAGIMPAMLGGLIVAQFMDVMAWMTSVFFCVFPLMGGLAGLVMWGVVTMLRLTIELYGTARTAEGIVVRRMEKLAAMAKKKG